MKSILAGVPCLLLPLFLFPTPGSSLFLDRECGFQGLKSCILHGPVEYSVPWMALITREEGDFICAGTLISHRLVLTAAHCLKSNVKLKVTLGQFQRRPEVREVHEVTSTFKHKKYNETTFANDIAILRLATYVEYNGYIKPVCIVNTSLWRKFIDNQEMLIATGWNMSETELNSGYLETHYLYRQHPNLCEFYNYFPLASNQFCTETRDDNFCNGTSGGPVGTSVRIGNSRRHIQVGIASLSPWRCGKTVVFTDVLSHIDFIFSVWHSHGTDRE